MSLYAVIGFSLRAEGVLLLCVVAGLCVLAKGILETRAPRQRLEASPSARFRAAYADMRRARCLASYSKIQEVNPS